MAVLVEEYSTRFPSLSEHLDQDEEFFWVAVKDEEEKRLRFHDYDRIFSVPGLYEFLFYEKLKCNSHRVVTSLLKESLENEAYDPSDLTVLDLGAGNGMVGEQLKLIGVKQVVGVDIIEEAALAMKRDRPGIYSDYFVYDLTKLTEENRKRLSGYRFNCLSTVAALGFGDIPPLAFAEAYNLISTPGWIAFNIKEVFLSESNDVSGFCKLIRRMIKENYIELSAQERYCHRLSLSGKELFYVAMTAKKIKDIPFDWLDNLD